MFNRRLNSFLPSVYANVVEMHDIMNAEEQEMNIARSELTAAFANTFVLTSDESGVILFEKMLNIVADTSNEDLEFRRQRLMNRLATLPPYTYRFLEQKLNQIIGVGAWKAYIDFAKYTLYIECSATNQNWYSEIEFTINRVKPCNMVFINVPYTAANVVLSEEVSYGVQKWNYKMVSWRLGQQPFAITEEQGVAKMADVKSIDQALLNDVADVVSDKIAYVVINDTVEITDFVAHAAAGGVVTVQYNVTPDMTDLVTNIKLMRADGQVLASSNVFVPVTQLVLSKHTITVKEGV